MTKPASFILGLGAQKSGSTWLHSYLANAETTNFGPIKEYHIWDASTLPEMAHYDQRTRNRIRSVASSLARRVAKKPIDHAGLRSRLQRSPTAYFEFFNELLKPDNINLTGDITPAYSGLPHGTLDQIRSGFARRGIETKAIFLMRDPVNRCISAAKMNREKSNQREGVPLVGTLDDAVLEYAQSHHCEIRANYKKTIINIRRTFDEHEVFWGIFESLFSDSEIKRLSDFCGVPHRPEYGHEKVNAAAKPVEVSDVTRRQLRDIFDQTYEYCAEAFPETKKLWQVH